MKILLWRTGAFGDVLITTPLIRHLHSQGHQIFYVTGDRGFEVLKNNPHVFKLLKNDESVKNENLGDHIQWLKEKNRCERVIDLNESIECALSQHPRSANYKLPKRERISRFNRNFYEYCFEHAGEAYPSFPLDSDGQARIINSDTLKVFNPELFFDQSELNEAKKYLKSDCFNVLIGLAGSGNNKAYPWIMDLCNSIGKNYPNVHIITVGDLKCQILEDIETPDLSNVTKLSGKISMRTSMALTGLVNLVIAPDTGIIHAAGCYDTPKICLLGHNTIECITKHFINDYSIQADKKLAPCAPCLYMIYDMKQQCPLSVTTNSSICMADGLPLNTVFGKFKEVYDFYKVIG